MSIKDEFKKFKGKVKISDIEQAFNKVITYINDFISYINNSIDLLDEESENKIDVTKGSNTLPASEYCLTIGALKQVLEVYDDTNIGGITVKDPLNSGRAIVFPSLIIQKDSGISVIPQTIVDKPTQQEIEDNPDLGSSIYYDTSSGNIVDTGNKRTSNWEYSSDLNSANIDVGYYATKAYDTTSGEISVSFRDASTSNNFCAVSPVNKPTQVNYLLYSGEGSISANEINTISIEYYPDNSNVLSEAHFTYDSISGEWTTDSPNIFELLDRGNNRIEITPKSDYIYFRAFEVTYNEVQSSGDSLIIHTDKKQYTYNPSAGQYVPNPNAVFISAVDWNRDEYIMNTTPDWLFVNPDTSPVISIMAEVIDSRQTVNPDLSKPQFIIPARQGVYRGETGDNIGSVQLTGGKVIFDNNQFNNGSRAKGSLETIYVPIWCPKGMANSIITVYGRSKAFNYRLI